MTPAGSAFLASLADVRPLAQTPIALAGINKDAGIVAIDFVFKASFGGAGLGRTLRDQFKPSVAGFSKELELSFNTMTNMPLNLTGKVLGNKAKSSYGN